ncbi:nucleic acid/nucleotide deaminase domain-containing protein [Spirillospora sp. NPDC052242]
MSPPRKGNDNLGVGTGRAAGVFGKVAGKLFVVPNRKGKVVVLDPKSIDSDTRARWRRERKGGGGETVQSRKLDPNDPNLDDRDREMLDAIAKARLHAGDDNPGVNYNAIRYIDGNGEERILVSRSDGVHSERFATNFLLDDNVRKEDIKDLVTERGPCVKNPACSQWVLRNTADQDGNGAYHNPANVAHVADYQAGSNLNNNRQATKDVKQWVDSVFAPNSPWRL